jgi:hypothetical protein
MTTLDRIKAQLSHLDESQLQQVYAFIQTLSTPVKPRLLSQRRQVQIDAAPDFAENINFYLVQEHDP